VGAGGRPGRGEGQGGVSGPLQAHRRHDQEEEGGRAIILAVCHYAFDQSLSHCYPVVSCTGCRH